MSFVDEEEKHKSIIPIPRNTMGDATMRQSEQNKGKSSKTKKGAELMRLMKKRYEMEDNDGDEFEDEADDGS